MQSAFADIAAKSENTGKTVYFEVSPLQWGLWTAGKGTFMDELATMCGLTNAFADVEGWAEISEEQVLERNPDYHRHHFHVLRRRPHPRGGDQVPAPVGTP